MVVCKSRRRITMRKYLAAVVVTGICATPVHADLEERSRQVQEIIQHNLKTCSKVNRLETHKKGYNVVLVEEGIVYYPSSASPCYTENWGMPAKIFSFAELKQLTWKWLRTIGTIEKHTYESTTVYTQWKIKGNQLLKFQERIGLVAHPPTIEEIYDRIR
jgi:hypothetical protein